MEPKTPVVVGILGGLGPWATLDLYRRILELTPAREDQDHLHVIIDSNPHVPDRTAAILGEGESPMPALAAGLRRLADAGAGFIAIPCNTAHHWIEELVRQSPVPVVDMVAEAVAAVQALGSVTCVGLLATTGTIRSGLYRRRFEERGVAMVVPDEPVQADAVMGAIFGPTGIKVGHMNEANGRLLKGAADALVAAGAQAIIAGCTEIPLVLRPDDVSVPLIDTQDCLARAVVRRAGIDIGDGEPARDKE